MRLIVRLLGQFEAYWENAPQQPLDWPRKRTQALFKILISAQGQPISQDRLVDLLFPTLAPGPGVANLYKRISELRQTLASGVGADKQAVIKQGVGYAISPDLERSLDTDEFVKIIEFAKQDQENGLWKRAVSQYQTAIALYRNDYLIEDLYEDWALEPREHFQKVLLEALESMAECEARLGKFQNAIQSCEKALARAPREERLYRQKMLLLALNDQPSEALKVFESCKNMAQSELDASPSIETEKLFELIKSGQIEELKKSYQRSAKAAAINLPSPISSFIGRETEIHQLRQALRASRLITIKGTAGAGKTRLAIQVAGESQPDFPDGVHFVGLASISEPALVPIGIAEVFQIREEPKRLLLDTLIQNLRNKKALLIFDNCEQIRISAAQIAEKLLLNCPDLKIIATSRESLGLTGEITFPVPPLLLPEPDEANAQNLHDFEAIQLFVERARAVQSDFRLTSSTGPAVLQICSSLDGLPLAIELAAAGVRYLSVEQLAAKLRDRFALLFAAHTPEVRHHQSLMEAIDWSYQLLSEPEKILWQRLSIFSGGFSLETAEALCADQKQFRKDEILEILASLVDKSLVAVEHRETASRYRLLESLRDYANAKLEESGVGDETRKRHALHFLALGEEAHPHLRSGEAEHWLKLLRLEFENLRAVYHWSIHNEEPAVGLRLAVALETLWALGEHLSEGREWLDTLLVNSKPVANELRAKALDVAGSLAEQQGDYVKAKTLLEKSLALWEHERSERGIASALDGLGVLSTFLGSYPEACVYLERSLEMYRKLEMRPEISKVLINYGNVLRRRGERDQAEALYLEAQAIKQEIKDWKGLATVFSNLGTLAIERSEYPKAESYYSASLKIGRQISDLNVISKCLLNLGVVYQDQNKYDDAIKYLKESIDVARQMGSKPVIFYALSNLGMIVRDMGDLEQARTLLREGLSMQKELGEQMLASKYLLEFARLAMAEGQMSEAVKLFSAAKAAMEKTGYKLPPVEQATLERNFAELLGSMTTKAFTNAEREGRAMTLEEGIALAMSE